MIVSLIPTVVLSLSTGAQSFSTAEIQAGEFQALEVLTSGAGRLGSVAPRGPVAAGLQSLHKDERYGFQVKPPRGWRSIALKTEEGWLRAKFQSDKSYFYTDPALGYTFEHTPEVLCIAFVHEKMVKKREVEERDDGVTEITILNPYKDYEDFLDRTYAGGGWFVEEKEEGEHKGTPVTKYEIRVEKGARTGPKRMVTWVFHTDGIDFALQVEVLETEFRKLKSTVDGVIKSFKEIKRNGEPLNEATVSDGIRITRRERNSGTPKERRSKRMESQKVEQDKAIANLPEDWDHEFYGDILVLNHDQGDWAKRLGKHAEKLLEWFFRSHDPTTLNRQGYDVGTQYRSAIFFHSEEQHRTALKLIEAIAPNWDDPIVTEVTEVTTFWSAEKYHQDYYRGNTGQRYCRAVILPKLQKLGLDVKGKEATKR